MGKVIPESAGSGLEAAEPLARLKQSKQSVVGPAEVSDMIRILQNVSTMYNKGDWGAIFTAWSVICYTCIVKQLEVLQREAYQPTDL